MKIYYEFDEITDNCSNKCPFTNIVHKGKTGKDCRVGSVTCRGCRFCYGESNDYRSSIIFIDNKRYLKPVPHIKCLFGQTHITLWQRLQWLWHHGKILLFNRDEF